MRMARRNGLVVTLFRWDGRDTGLMSVGRLRMGTEAQIEISMETRWAGGASRQFILR